jgi:DNA-binding CsgD family transcriptional regulator
MTATISDSSADIPSTYRVWVATAFLLGAIARNAFGDPNAAGRALLHYTADARRLEGLTHGETRVLHYLPTNLSAREIAGELYLSVNTVKTHQRHLYQKLGARSRTQAVEQARALGLLAPSAPRANGGHMRARHGPVARGAVPGRVSRPVVTAVRRVPVHTLLPVMASSVGAPMRLTLAVT